MRPARSTSRLTWLIGSIFPLVLLLLGAVTANGACNRTITSIDAAGTVGVPFTYPITVSGGSPESYNATGLPPGLTVDISTGVISGTPTTFGTYPVTLSATYNSGGCTTVTKNVTFTINAPAFVGFRLPDFQTPAGAGYTPRLMLQMGANGTSATANRFNATLEVDASGNGTSWVPYNHFVGITDTNPNYSFRDSWITDAPLPVRDSSGPSGVPQAFSSGQLTLSPPAVYMKADPRATRFGIFQMDGVLTTTNSRIMLPLWPSGYSTVQNGFGGTVGTSFPGPVEHAPNRFPAGTAYYPATFSINGPPDTPRDNTTTTYADNDGVTRPADAIYPGAASTTGASTPYYTSPTSYHPIMLNRPFRHVAELGYAFRDLPWKTLDFFTDKSADAGLLDVFCINDGSRSTTPYNANGDLGTVVPTTAAGSANLNSTQAADLQTVLAGAILDELNSTTQVSNTGTSATAAPVLAANIMNATSTTPMQNKAELLTRANLPTTILPTASNDNQAVKAQREVVARAITSVSQTRVWNLVIDVVAQSGRYPPGETDPKKFIVEGEQRYWVHVAIDRFTGQVISKQIEVVNE
jgi:hypothetical protein